MGTRLALDDPTNSPEELPGLGERGCSAKWSPGVERNTEEVRARFTVLKALSDDTERKRLHLRNSLLCAVAVGQHSRQLQYFSQPAAVVFSLSLNLEGDQVPATSDLIVRCRGALEKSS